MTTRSVLRDAHLNRIVSPSKRTSTSTIYRLIATDMQSSAQTYVSITQPRSCCEADRERASQQMLRSFLEIIVIIVHDVDRDDAWVVQSMLRKLLYSYIPIGEFVHEKLVN